jgi:Tol biopolymer transport system component
MSFPLARFLNARVAQLPSFSPYGQHVAFVSDITGIQQLWRVPVTGGVSTCLSNQVKALSELGGIGLEWVLL